MENRFGHLISRLWTVTRIRPPALLIRARWLENIYIWTHRLRYRLAHAQNR